MRMAVWHRYMYDKEGAINHDKPDAYTCALRCDCERGNAISCELNEHTKIKTRPWKEAIAEWERSPRTIRIVLTSRDYPALWPVDGYTDAQWARLKGLGGTRQEASLYARAVVAGAQLEER